MQLRQRSQEQHSSSQLPSSFAAPTLPLHIHVLSAADAHMPLIAAAQLRPQPAPKHHQSNAAMRTTEMLSHEIQEAAGHWAALQADVLLILGPCSTLAGFPPWALQFTQIYHLGLLARCKQVQVQEAMHEFQSTQQRFGK